MIHKIKPTGLRIGIIPTNSFKHSQSGNCILRPGFGILESQCVGGGKYSMNKVIYTQAKTYVY